MEFAQQIMALIASGSSEALNALMFGAILYLLWDRNKLSEQVQEARDKADSTKDEYVKAIERVLDKYHDGNIEIVQALYEIQIVLATMQKTL